MTLPVPFPDPQDPLREALERIVNLAAWFGNTHVDDEHFRKDSIRIADAALAAPRPDRLLARDRAVVADLRRAWTEAAHAYPGDRAVDDIFTLLDLLDSAFPPDPPEEN